MMLFSNGRIIHKKSSHCELSIKTESTPDSLSYKGQATKQDTIVKRSIAYSNAPYSPLQFFLC